VEYTKKQKLADEEITKKIEVAGRVDKLQIAQRVVKEIDLKKLIIAVSFYEEKERESLIAEENDQLHDSYIREIKSFLDFDIYLNSEIILGDFIEEIKFLGASLLNKSMTSDSFRALIEEKDLGTNEQSKIANEASETARGSVSPVNGQKEVEQIPSDVPKKKSSFISNMAKLILILPFGHIIGGYLYASGENYPFDLVTHVTESSLWLGYLLWPFAALYLLYPKQK
jgi:hypothetical protein